jgi:MoaA/NifB/PqqE/SkfB family radical SAM enzyme
MLSEKELGNRDKLRQTKPKVLEKILKQDELIKQGKSVALIVLNYEYLCNFRCEHCSSDGLMIKTKKDRLAAESRQYLRPKSVRTLFDQADELGLSHVAISGGEPLTYPDLDRVIEAIGPERFWIATDTNAWFLDEKKAKHLKSIGVDKVQISLDSFDREDHDAFRNKKGSYDRIMRAIDEAKGVGLQVMLLTCVTRQRVWSEEFIQFLEFGKSKDIQVYVTLAKPIGAWAGNMDAVCGDTELTYLNELSGKYNIATRFYGGYGMDLGCIAVKRSITVTKYGHVMPCPYIQTSLGNIFEEPLETILERGLDIRHFSYGEKRTCISGNRDHEFVQKYMPKIWTSKEPIAFQEIFDASDFVSEEKAKKWLKS